jgi:hypothetical protein
MATQEYLIKNTSNKLSDPSFPFNSAFEAAIEKAGVTIFSTGKEINENEVAYKARRFMISCKNFTRVNSIL